MHIDSTLAARIRAALTEAAPGVTTIRLTPLWTDSTGVPRRTTWVTLDDINGRPLAADCAAHRTARDLLHETFPLADWSRMHAYDVHTGTLRALAAPTGPRELGPALEATR